LKRTIHGEPTDINTLQGTWYIVALEVDGAPMPMTGADSPSIVVDGNRFTSVGMGAAYEGTVEIDQKKQPKAFDLIITGGHAAGTRNRGIYSLDRDRWTICLATIGNKRPRRFATKPGSGLALETLERKRGRRPSARGTSTAASTGVAGPAPAKVQTPARSGHATALEGEWAMVTAVFNGAPMADDMVKWCTRVTCGDVTTVLAGPRTMLKARFTLDQSKHPHAIDYVNLEGSDAGASQAGIVDLKGDTLRICMSAPGRPRPGDFSSKPRDERSYTTWRRTVRR
jgi:uncharacterized protein (TIGR03067 family)